MVHNCNYEQHSKYGVGMVELISVIIVITLVVWLLKGEAE